MPNGRNSGHKYKTSQKTEKAKTGIRACGKYLPSSLAEVRQLSSSFSEAVSSILGEEFIQSLVMAFPLLDQCLMFGQERLETERMSRIYTALNNDNTGTCFSGVSLPKKLCLILF
jgi:hypothetical protein